MTDTIEMDDGYLTQLADGQGIGVPEEHIEAFFMFARAAARAQQRLDMAATPPKEAVYNFERALSLEIMNCTVNDKDEITWANVRCCGTRTNLFPNAFKVQFTEKQIRSAWHAFATRNDLDTIVLRSVTAFILELTQ